MKLDILAFAAHPDDVELACSGTLIKHIAMGKKVGIVDLTRGELGTRGSAEIRDKEAALSAQIMQLTVRENLGMADGFFTIDEEHKRVIIKAIRKYQPDIVLANALSDRHPDHTRASQLVSEACFLSGLIKVETGQEAWRPKVVYHYIQDRYIKPDFIIDITDAMDTKIKAIQAFSSQFFVAGKEDKEPTTPISSSEFMEALKARASDLGRIIGVRYGEGFTVERTLGLNSLNDIF
jgi:bacillithiol biosynthesis deacetylase BshB1